MAIVTEWKPPVGACVERLSDHAPVKVQDLLASAPLVLVVLSRHMGECPLRMV